MNVRFVFYLILVSRKLIIKVFFNNFIDQECRICIFSEIGFDVFYVIMKGVPIITNFKRLIYQTFIKLILYENDVKLLKFKRSPVHIDL